MFKINKIALYSLKNIQNHFVHHNSSISKRLEGKVAIVTASTLGIGFATANRLGAEGAHVVVSSRHPENVANAIEKLNAAGHSFLAMQCHVSKEQDRKNLVEKTLEKFGRIDYLISNAASNPAFGPLLKYPEKAWGKVFEVGVKNALQMTQLVVPHMRRNNGGAIVYISSIAGYKSIEGAGAYSVSKTALLGLGKVLAVELAPDNIRVNCIAPGIVKTKMSSGFFEMPGFIANFLKTEVPLGRIGKAEEIAASVAFLCSNDASYITGENLVVGGGFYSRL